MQRNFKLGLSLQWITLIQFRPCNKLQSGKARPPQSSQWAILSRAALLCSGSADSRLTKATEAKSADFSAIAHIFKEGSWNLWKNLAQDHPWDEEFKKAEDMLGF